MSDKQPQAATPATATPYSPHEKGGVHDNLLKASELIAGAAQNVTHLPVGGVNVPQKKGGPEDAATHLMREALKEIEKDPSQAPKQFGQGNSHLIFFAPPRHQVLYVVDREQGAITAFSGAQVGADGTITGGAHARFAETNTKHPSNPNTFITAAQTEITTRNETIKKGAQAPSQPKLPPEDQALVDEQQRIVEKMMEGSRRLQQGSQPTQSLPGASQQDQQPVLHRPLLNPDPTPADPSKPQGKSLIPDSVKEMLGKASEANMTTLASNHSPGQQSSGEQLVKGA
jgi:hypothetical protein